MGLADSMSSFPIVFDDGSKAMVPGEKVKGALADGGKLAQAMQFDDGSKAYVSLDKVHDALKDGGMVMGEAPKAPTVNMEEQGSIAVPNAGRVPGVMSSGNAVTPQQAAGGLAAGAVAGALPFAGQAAGVAVPAGYQLLKGIASRHPVAAQMLAMEAISHARSIPVAGKFIPPGAEILPWLFGGGKGAAEAPAEAGAPLPATPPPELLQGNALTKLKATMAQPAAATGEALGIPQPVRPVYPGAPLPESPGVFPGAHLPADPGVFPGAPLPAKPPTNAAATIWRDATRSNVPYAGEGPSLKRPVADIVDQAIPPTGPTKMDNFWTHAKVDAALTKGDVAGAEKVLDTAASKAVPEYQPPARPPYAGDTRTIRYMQPEASKARFADVQDDAAVQQQMQQNLTQHGLSAEDEARREFIARNSTDVSKGQLVRDAGGTVPEHPVKFTKTPGVGSPVPKGTTVPQTSEDMTSQLQKSMDAIKKRKSAKP
jgi:hypothetical protein